MYEFRFQAYESAAMYKERMKHFLDKKILKEFQLGDLVLLFNSNFLTFVIAHILNFSFFEELFSTSTTIGTFYMCLIFFFYIFHFNHFLTLILK